MTAPAVALERGLAALMHLQSEAGALGLLFVIALGVVPALMLLAAAGFTAAAAGGATRSLGATAVQYAPALVPFGFGVWLAHYGFHLFTGILTVVPVTQSAAIDLAGQGGARRTSVALGRDAARSGVPDAAWVRTARRVRIDRSRSGDPRAIIREPASWRPRPGSPPS